MAWYNGGKIRVQIGIIMIKNIKKINKYLGKSRLSIQLCWFSKWWSCFHIIKSVMFAVFSEFNTISKLYRLEEIKAIRFNTFKFTEVSSDCSDWQILWYSVEIDVNDKLMKPLKKRNIYKTVHLIKLFVA